MVVSFLKVRTENSYINIPNFDIEVYQVLYVIASSVEVSQAFGCAPKHSATKFPGRLGNLSISLNSDSM